MKNDYLLQKLDFRIGTIGFSYPGWKNVFYPPGVKQGEQLTAYATAFDAVELDTTFYAVPPVDRVKKWADAVPAGFEFSPKTPRGITHDAALAEGHGLMRAFMESLMPMRESGKLGPVLIQFPPSFGCAQEAELERFLVTLPKDCRYAVEFRHRSWQRPQTVDLLSAHGCAWVAADYSTKALFPAVTAEFLYLRFVGQHNFYPTHDKELADPTERLEWWLKQLNEASPTLRPGMKVYALFTNDYAGYSPATANRFRTLVGICPRLPAHAGEEFQWSLF